MDIGTLTGKLELEDASFSAVLASAARELEDFGKSVIEIGAGVASGWLAIAGAVTGASLTVGKALFELAQRAAEVGDKLGDFGIETGLAAEKIAPLDFAARAAGGSLNQLNSMLQRMTMREMADSTGKFEKAMHDLGITTAEFNRLPIDEKIRALADGFHQAEERGKGMADALAVFGRGGANYLTLLDKLTPEVMELSKRNAEIWTPALLKAAADFNVSLNIFQETLGTLTIRIGQELLPIFTKFMNALASSKLLLDSVVTSAQSVIRAIGYLVQGFGLLLVAEAQINKGWITLVDAAQQAVDRLIGSAQLAATAAVILDPMNKGALAAAEGLGKLRASAKGAADDFHAMTTKWADTQQSLGTQLTTLGYSFTQVGKGLKDVKAGTDAIADVEEHFSTEQLKKAEAILKALDQEMRYLTDQVQKHIQQMKEWNEWIWKNATGQAVLNQALHATPNLLRDLAPHSLVPVMSSIGDTVRYLINDGLPNLVTKLKPTVSGWQTFGSALSVVTQSFEALGHAGFEAGVEIGQSLNAVLQIFKQFQELNKSTVGMTPTQRAEANRERVLGGLAMTGVGISGSIGAIRSGNVFQGALSGMETGAGLATTLGMSAALGAATMGIGAAVVGGIALYKHLSEKQGRDMVLQFAKDFGDIDQLHKTLVDKLGARGETLWENLVSVGRHNTEQAKAAINDITTALQEQQKIVQDLADQYDTLTSQLVDLGVTIPAGLDDVMTQLLNAGNTDAVKNGIGQITDAVKKYQDQLNKVDSFHRIQQEMDALGLKASDMNASFQQLKTEDAARTLAQEWKDLAPYMGDVNVLADKFGDQIKQMIQDALSYGIALPESMQPIIKTLQDSGKLTEDFGFKAEDLARISFEKDPLQEGLDTLNKTLLEILDTLKNQLPQAFKGVSDAGTNAADQVKHAWSGIGGLGRSQQDVQGMAGGGVVYAAGGANVLPFKPRGSDTVPAMLTPGERVLSVSQNRDYEDQRTGDQYITLMMPDGDVLLRQVVKARKRLG